MKELRIIFFFLVVIFLFSCDEEGKKKNDAGTNSLVAIKYPLPQNTDSLIALLKTLPGDTNKVNALNALCWQMKNGDPDTALVVGNDALNLAVKLKWENGQADALGNIGVCYRNKGDHPKSLDYFIRSLKIFEKENDGLGIAARLGSIGTVYFSEEDFPKAKEWFLKALRKSQELNDKSKIAAQLGNIGNVYFKEGQYIEAIDYDNRALNIFREIKSKKEVELNLSNIGINYSFMAKEKNDPAERDTLRRKAMQYYSQAYQLSLQMHSKRRQAKNLGMIGSLYGEEYNFKPAYDYVYKALTLSDSIGAKDYVKDWYEGLSTLYEESTIPLPDSIGGKLLNMEQMRLRSLHYFKSYVNLRDTLFSQENKKQLVQKEMNYEFDKKQEKQKADQDKKDALAKEQLKQKETERNYFIAGFALVLALAGFIFRSYRQKQKANEIISQQKLMVEEKQKEILDSIHYAKRIQQSLLPKEKYIAKNLSAGK